MSGFGRELFLENETRLAHYCEWVEASRETDRREFVWSLLERSKRDPSCKILAANAATLINRLDSLAKANLSGAQFPFAKIPKVILDQADATKTDMRFADLSQGSFPDADFSGSLIDGIAFGRLPTLKVEGILGNIAFTLDNRLIAELGLLTAI